MHDFRSAIMGVTLILCAALTAYLSHELKVVTHKARQLEQQLKEYAHEMGTMQQSQRRLSAENPDTLSQLLGVGPEILSELHSELGQRPELAKPHASPLVKMPASKSWLVDIFVRFHNLMWKWGYLPLSEHGHGRHSTDMYDSLSAKSYRAFYARHVHLIPEGSRCIGFALHPKEQAMFPACGPRAWWSIEFRRSEFKALPERRVLRADVTKLNADNVPVAIANTFDVVQCHEVFEHVADPFAAAAGLWHLLKPGGLVFLHAPFSIHIHGKVKDTARGESFGDYFRYTLAGAERVFLNAGFEILASEMTGNPMLAIGLLMGFGSDDFSAADLAAGLSSTDGCTGHAFCEQTRGGQRPHLVPIASALVLRKPMTTNTSFAAQTPAEVNPWAPRRNCKGARTKCKG